MEAKLDRDQMKASMINVGDVYNTTYRAGMINILLKDEWDWNDVVSISVVNSIVGDVKETFDKLDSDGNGFLDINELEKLLDGLNADLSQNPIQDLMSELDTNGDGQLSFKEFAAWYIKSEERILGEMNYLFNKIDTDEDKVLNVSEIRAFY
eukprot:TRINITY_DN20348_c0_g1_i1.p1 TRINITY_DN20348_c0_g1~~TRINITY_DN20348_c0_g1_i1.p1  ORF type:complete len:152 (-),score=22.82 TRINITY_DN20348_c0_g1_i1:17-472(-)